MKRMLSLLCAIALVLSVFPGVVFAVEESTGTPVVSVEQTWGTSGQTIEVDVSVANNPGILGATFSVSWAEGLELISAKKQDAFDDLNYQPPSGYNRDGTNFMWYADSVSDILDGVFLTLTFEVDENIVGGKTLPVNIVAKQVIDVNKQPIAVTCVSGGVQVVDYTPGDVDGNTLVELLDILTLAQYVSDDCVTKPDGFNISLNDSAADVNDDGAIDILDIILISQYVSDDCTTNPDGYNVTLMPSTPKCSHANMEEVPYNAASCTEDGNITYYSCDDCGKYFNNATGSLELTWDQIVLVSSGHNEVIDEAVAPSYTQTGLTEGSHCDVCGEVFVAQEEVPMLQASYHSITYRNLNGAESPEPNQYAEHTGLDELPVPEAPGYTFKGWYTASEGGTVVDYIPAGSTQNYILYARWELKTYHIYYHEAPEHANVSTYTVEDRIILDEPTWSGLSFTGWTDASGKLYDEIPKGTTGDLDLTANWKLMRNIATPGTNTLMLAEYYEQSGLYTFIYELGTIEHVVLEELNEKAPNTFYHTGAGDFTLSVEQTLELGEEIADSISRTISKSVASSSEWEESKEWAKEKSIEHSTNESIGIEIGKESWPVHATIEASYGYANTSGESWGESSTKGGSYGEEVENGEETSSSLAYTKTLSTTTSSSITIPKDSPAGYYSYAHVGNIRVFGIVTYDPADGRVYLNTHSILDNMHDMLLYYPDINSMNHPTCETLQYKIPRDQIDVALENCYFVKYDANGGDGSMNNTLHTVGGEEKLQDNAFVRPGYIFTGWEERYEDGTTKSVYTDGQVINDVASKGDIVTLYAMWEKNDYSVTYNGNKPDFASSDMVGLSDPTACKYDEDVTLAAAPSLPGYTFGGWYFDSTCTEKLGDAGQTFEKANFTTELNGTITLYAKWTPNTYTLTFDPAGGTIVSGTKNVVFDQPYGTLNVPEKADHVFLGWFLADGTQITDANYMRIAENHTVYAKWLKIKATLTFRTNESAEKKTITDSDGVYDSIDPMMDRGALLANGYSQIYITWSVRCDEINQGNQDIWLCAYYDQAVTFHHQHENSTPSDWTTHTGNLTIPLDSQYIDETLHFFIEYGAEGNGEDDWYLGKTTVTITAIK